MHSVTPQTQLSGYTTPPASPRLHGARDTNSGTVSGLRRPDFSEFCNPRTIFQPYKDFCETGIVPDSQDIQSAIASCCLKYREPQVLAALLDTGKVRNLDLSSTFLDIKGAQILASVLKTDTRLLQLSLVDNDFDEQGYKAICGALEENSTLLALDLGRNEATGSEYVEAIGKMLAKNRTLQIFRLEFARINAERLPILAKALEQNQTLTELGLSFNHMGPEGACTLLQIAGKSPALKVLDLSGNKLGTDGGKLVADALRTNCTLTELNLACNELGPEGANAVLNAIQGNSTLRNLSLSYNQLNGASANPIASLLEKNTPLCSLDLSCNQLFYPEQAPANGAIDTIVQGLEQNTNLIELELTNNHTVAQSVSSRPPFAWSWYQPQSEKDRERIEDLLQRNRTFNALSERDAQLASQLFPGRLLSLDEGNLLAGALVLAAPSMAAYEASMVEIQCCVNVLASRT